MRRVFADSLYWIALSHQRDQWHAAALKASRAPQSVEIVTAQEMLSEFLTAFRHTPAYVASPHAAFMKAVGGPSSPSGHGPGRVRRKGESCPKRSRG